MSRWQTAEGILCCRLLVAGSGELGQEQVAGALLRLLDGCQVHVLGLPMLAVAGRGDAVDGAVGLVRDALRRSSSIPPLLYTMTS